MGKYVDYYCKNNLKKLKILVDGIITMKFAWIPQMYFDDIYSIASMVVWDCEKRYDGSQGATFKTFLIGCINRKIKTYVTGMNRDKRKAKDSAGKPLKDVSLDDAMNSYNDTLKEMSSDDIFNDIYYNRALHAYFESLTKRQKIIVGLKLQGYTPAEIKKKLGITDAQYALACNRMSTLNKRSVLCENIN